MFMSSLRTTACDALTCSCYSTKTHVNSMILVLKLNLTSLSTTHILSICFSTKSNSIWRLGSSYLYEFSLSNNYMFSLRTTTCDALIVPSVYTSYFSDCTAHVSDRLLATHALLCIGLVLIYKYLCFSNFPVL